jgi:hypothetical protein
MGFDLVLRRFASINLTIFVRALTGSVVTSKTIGAVGQILREATSISANIALMERRPTF